MSAAHQQVGSAAEEAARLVEAVSGWWTAQQAAHAPDDEGAGDQRPGDDRRRGDDAGEPAASSEEQPGTCRYCPWCRAVAAVQQVRPEVVEQLLGAAESFAAGLRELSRDLSGASAPSRPADHAATRRGAPRTVSIPVEPDDEAQEDS